MSIAHPLERYTYASDAGNAHFLAVGVMGLFPFVERQRSVHRHTPVTDALRAAVDRALEVAADLLGEHGLGAPLLVCHRQCINGRKDHDLCPGETVVEMALRSTAVEVGGYRVDPDLVLDRDHGLRWPEEWRRNLASARAEQGEQAEPEGRRDDAVDLA